MEMEKNEAKYNYFFKALLLGGALGSLAGLLFAPKSGKELRADITETRERAFREAKEMLGKASHQFSEVRQRAKHILPFVKQKGGTAPRYDVESAEEFVGEA
jgi:gas vesicle protein